MGRVWRAPPTERNDDDKDVVLLQKIWYDRSIFIMLFFLFSSFNQAALPSAAAKIKLYLIKIIST